MNNKLKEIYLASTQHLCDSYLVVELRNKKCEFDRKMENDLYFISSHFDQPYILE